MRIIVFSLLCLLFCPIGAQRPRVLISTDIGGTDPDDNQSMIHLMMYSDLFQIEGLVSSPSFGNGSKEEILRMIDLYAKDYPQLKQHNPQLMSPESLRLLCKQGRRGLMPYIGYGESTEGSEWIIQQARKECNEPLWVLVWGTLEDVAQALHDAPDIVEKIRIYWIGGPNKKWGANSYAYITHNYPNLWIIENNATYRGFITDNEKMELIEKYKGIEQSSNRYGSGYYNYAMKGNGTMGADFLNYYKGVVKMGDTPSLLYMMHGNPYNPQGESWGGSFEPIKYSSRRTFHRQTNERDTVPVYSIVEWFFKGPRKKSISEGEACFTATIDKQQWTGYYLGKSTYVLRYCPKAPAKLTYKISSAIPQLNGLQGSFVVDDKWPGKPHPDDYKLGENWYSDCSDRTLYEGKWQGVKTQRKWREAILEDWAQRWSWLKPQAQVIDEACMKKATGWVEKLQLNDKSKEERVTQVIATHLTAISNWHNQHADMIPDGAINPQTGKKLSALERQVIADSSQPASIRQALLDGLNAELTPSQVEEVLDLYTVGKVAFTMKAYKEIVPDMTAEDETFLMNNLKEARLMAIDYKNMKEISAIFEIYKTKNEQYFTNSGRDWRTMYSAYVKQLKARKDAKSTEIKK